MKVPLGVAVLLAMAGMLQAELVSKVFPLGDAEPREVEEAVKTTLSPKGKTVLLVRERKLLVQDEAEFIPAAEAMIKEFTAPRPNVRVEVMFQEDSGMQDRQLNVRGGFGGKNSIEINGMNSKGTSSSMSNQFLVVQSGKSASIRVVQEVPFVDYFYSYALGLGYITGTQTRWRDIGSQMAISPRVVGNMIDVELLPQITTLVDSKTETISFRELATRVTVPNGQTVQVGGFQGAAEEFNRNFFSGGGRRGGTQTSGFSLRATIF